MYSKIKTSVADIGEWIEDNSESVAYWIAIVIFGLSVLGTVIALIVNWVQNGFWKTILPAVGAAIALGILYYVVVVAAAIGGLVVKVISWFFKNIYVLEIAILVALGIIFFTSKGADLFQTQYMNYQEEIAAEPQTVAYKCVAKVLNVRVAPDSKAKAVGSLKSGDVVEVYGLSDGFARIKYNGNDAYVSLEYLQRVM